MSVDSLVQAREDVNIGTPAPNPDCKTGTLAQKQEVYSLCNDGGVQEKLVNNVVMMVMLTVI